MTDATTLEYRRAENRTLAMLRALEDAPLAKRPRLRQVLESFDATAPGWNPGEALLAMLMHIHVLRQMVALDDAPIIPKAEPIPPRAELIGARADYRPTRRRRRAAPAGQLDLFGEAP